jgi:hypothetical protein
VFILTFWFFFKFWNPEQTVFIISHVQTQSNRVCNFQILSLFRCFRGITHFPDFIFHNSRTVSSAISSCRKLSCISLQCCYIFLVLMDQLFQHVRVEDWILLKPVLGGGGRNYIALSHYFQLTNSNKLSLQFSYTCNIVSLLQKGLPFSRYWYYAFSNLKRRTSCDFKLRTCNSYLWKAGFQTFGRDVSSHGMRKFWDLKA